MVSAIGRKARLKVATYSEAVGFFLFLIKETFFFLQKRRIGLRVLIMQIFFTGVEALSVIALLSLGMGAVLIVQGNSIMPLLGDPTLLYEILIVVIMREMGPLVTAFIITARSGSAITTELGNMVISHEMEAYMSVGINPISQLGVPRLIGVTTAMILLNIYFNLFGLLGSWLVANLISPFPFREYITGLVMQIELVDVISSFLKSFVFGLIIAVVSVYHGFKVNLAVTEVPVKTIQSIGTSIVGCILADVIIIVALL
ncbi:MAG: ABC transporter permease [Spirochaetales bacterium]|nr:ABC transporter permease [Spirochaetales bacterium]